MSRTLLVSDLAKADMKNALLFSQQQFGSAVREKYAALISAALHDIQADPEHVASREYAEVLEGLRGWHLGNCRNRVAPNI